MKSEKSDSSCNKIQEQFDLRELGLEQFDLPARKLMESHIESCSHCKEWLSQWELIKFETQQLPQLEVPGSVLANVMSKIDQAPQAVPKFAITDLLLAVAGLAMLLFSSTHYAADGLEGCIAWCLCFLLLYGTSQIFKFTRKEMDYAK
jgi:predicted anti-sigma-YlaC factor YlaD